MREININKKSCLVVGLENGSLMVLGINSAAGSLNGLKNGRSLQSLSVRSEHMKGITEICVSPCNRFLMTTGEDCMVFVYQAKL